ncbi:type II toxin-antitoxin system HicA family toxin [Dolichospermum sp. UHCC 0259]|nr:type II toxin-antitoxin system HicA family toxin [Dolichospermum sp. UHCC 0259]
MTVKRRDLIKELEEIGCIFIRHGGNHDWYQNPLTKVLQPILRHREINDTLAKHILKMLQNS